MFGVALAPASILALQPIGAGPDCAYPVDRDRGRGRKRQSAAKRCGWAEPALAFRLLDSGVEAQNFEVRADAYNESGEPVPDHPVFASNPLALDPAISLQGSGSFALPGDMEPGDPYSLCLCVGTHGVETVDESCAEFTVIP
jgi:hypothetical protein